MNDIVIALEAVRTILSLLDVLRRNETVVGSAERTMLNLVLTEITNRLAELESDDD